MALANDDDSYALGNIITAVAKLMISTYTAHSRIMIIIQLIIIIIIIIIIINIKLIV